MADVVLRLQPLHAVCECVHRHKQLADNLLVHLVLCFHNFYCPLPVVVLHQHLVHVRIPRGVTLLHLVDAALALRRALHDLLVGADGDRGADPAPAVEHAVMPPHAIPQAPARTLIEGPVPNQPILQPRQGRVHAALQLHLCAVHPPDAQLVHCPVEDGGRLVAVVDGPQKHVGVRVRRLRALPLATAQRAVEIDLRAPPPVAHGDVCEHIRRDARIRPQPPGCHLPMEEDSAIALQ
mmetsp:Transcript_20753/g.34717  ORF Transcript_20753/g.34717 Transcript_20753/m.34717 type:complete len:237 (+) Transcript_20753:257-967(+)